MQVTNLTTFNIVIFDDGSMSIQETEGKAKINFSRPAVEAILLHIIKSGIYVTPKRWWQFWKRS